MTYEEIINDIKIEHFYPYTNETVEMLKEQVIMNNSSGIVLPVYIEKGRSDSFRILKKEGFNQYDFISSKDLLFPFLKELNLENKKIFISVIDSFKALGCNGKSKEEVRNLELLKNAIHEIYYLGYDIIINNDMYSQTTTRKEFFEKLTCDYPDLDYVYTMNNRYDDIHAFPKIVPKHVNINDIISYINLGKKLYLPQFEENDTYSNNYKLETLLEYYNRYEDTSYNLYFNKADIAVISKETPEKILKKIR